MPGFCPIPCCLHSGKISRLGISASFLSFTAAAWIWVGSQMWDVQLVVVFFYLNTCVVMMDLFYRIHSPVFLLQVSQEVRDERFPGKPKRWPKWVVGMVWEVQAISLFSCVNLVQVLFTARSEVSKDSVCLFYHTFYMKCVFLKHQIAGVASCS